MNIEVNGVRLFYELYGSEGKPPLILIHGNGESHKIFDKLAGALSDSFCVYAADSRGHGLSGRVKEFHYEDMAEDYACFIRALGLNKPVIYGFSDGGIIGLLLAAKYPDMPGRLIVSGANTQPSAMKGGYMLIFKAVYAVKRSPLYRLMLSEPCISAEMLKKIKVPVLVTAGSRDMVKDSDTRFIAKSIPGARLMIFKGENHMSYIVNSDFMARHIKEFCL